MEEVDSMNGPHNPEAEGLAFIDDCAMGGNTPTAVTAVDLPLRANGDAEVFIDECAMSGDSHSDAPIKTTKSHTNGETEAHEDECAMSGGVETNANDQNVQLNAKIEEKDNVPNMLEPPLMEQMDIITPDNVDDLAIDGTSAEDALSALPDAEDADLEYDVQGNENGTAPTDDEFFTFLVTGSSATPIDADANAEKKDDMEVSQTQETVMNIKPSTICSVSNEEEVTGSQASTTVVSEAIAVPAIEKPNIYPKSKKNTSARAKTRHSSTSINEDERVEFEGMQTRSRTRKMLDKKKQ